MAELYSLVTYQDGQLDNKVFKTLDEARQVISKEYSELIKLYDDEEYENLYKNNDISEDYAYLYVEDNTNTIWEIFTIQV